MDIEIKIDSACKTPRLILVTDKMTEELNELVSQLSQSTPQVIVGFCDNTLKILEPSQLIRVYAQGGKVYAVDSEGVYTLKLRLYEAEERLSKNMFARISNSEILNLKKVKSFDLSFTGTICVTLSNGSTTYVSRRYMPKIKQLLGI